MKKITTLVLSLFLLFSLTSSAQSYPPFNITAYDSTQSSGYYFFCPYKLSSFPTFPVGKQHQMILDKDGNVVYYKNVVGYFAGDFKLQSNGVMSYCGRDYFYLMDSTFTVYDSITTLNGFYFDIHDLQILANGHFLILGVENRTMDLSSYPLFLHNGTIGSANAIVKGYVLQELDSAKNIVFEWHALDHYAFDDVDDFWLNDTLNVDWTHVNAVEQDYDGNFLVSSRHFDEITKINRADSSIIWRLGGKRNDFTFINDPDMFYSQHDCRRIANGHLTLFDNGRDLSIRHFASSKEYELDEVNHIANLVWSHSEGPDEWSISQGNTQRLSNGNTLTSYGNLTPTPIVFNVVDSVQSKVFEIMFPDSQISYRSFNFPSIPWQFNRPQISCSSNGSQFYLTADSGYAEYRWSNGETTQSVQVTSTGSYSVFVPRGNGGFISSEKFDVVDVNDPCGTINVNGPSSAVTLSLYPNPASLSLTLISSQLLPENYEILDQMGRKVKSGAIEKASRLQLDISMLSNGMYILRADSFQKKFIKY